MQHGSKRSQSQPRGYISTGSEHQPLTISIHVIIAGVPFAVAVGVPLVGVLHQATVVAGVAMVVFVAVLLVQVGLQPAIVLKCKIKTLNKNPLTADFLSGSRMFRDPPTCSFGIPSPSASSSQVSPCPSLSASS